MSPVLEKTTSISEANMIVGRVLFPCKEGFAPRPLDTQFGKELLKIVTELGIDKKLFRRISTAKEYPSDKSSGLYRTKTGGRAEVLCAAPSSSPLRLFDGDTDTEQCGDAYKKLLDIIEKETNMSFPYGVWLKLKGRGPSPERKIPVQDLLSSRHFEKKVGIEGFTGLDTRDHEVNQKLTGYHTIISPQGQEMIHEYRPSRVLLCILPIQTIKRTIHEYTEVLANTKEWKEPLYLELFVEPGGLNIEDIENALLENSITPSKLLQYAACICTQYGMHLIPNQSEESLKEQVSQFLLNKSWCDAQVEETYLEIGKNRSKHNTVVGGYLDYDDSTWKKEPKLDFSWKKSFYQRIIYYFDVGIIRKEDIVQWLNIESITKDFASSNTSTRFEELMQLIEIARQLKHPELFTALYKMQNLFAHAVHKKILVKKLTDAVSCMPQEIQVEYIRFLLQSANTEGIEEAAEHILNAAVELGGQEGLQIIKKIKSKSKGNKQASLLHFDSIRAFARLKENVGVPDLLEMVEQERSQKYEVYCVFADAAGIVGGEQGANILVKILRKIRNIKDKKIVCSAIAHAVGNLGEYTEEVLQPFLNMPLVKKHKYEIYVSLMEGASEFKNVTLLRDMFQKITSDNTLYIDNYNELCQTLTNINPADAEDIVKNILLPLSSTHKRLLFYITQTAVDLQLSSIITEVLTQLSGVNSHIVRMILNKLRTWQPTQEQRLLLQELQQVSSNPTPQTP